MNRSWTLTKCWRLLLSRRRCLASAATAELSGCEAVLNWPRATSHCIIWAVLVHEAEVRESRRSTVWWTVVLQLCWIFQRFFHMSESTKTIQNLGCIYRFNFELNFGNFWEVGTRVVRNHYKNPEKKALAMMTQLKENGSQDWFTQKLFKCDQSNRQES